MTALQPFVESWPLFPVPWSYTTGEQPVARRPYTKDNINTE
jgi:hypothetical protein